MALQGSGSIGLSDIQTEFGGSNPIAAGDYYRNGVEGVPDSGANSGIPTSGALSLADFYSSEAVAPFSLDWSGLSLSSISSTAPTTATAYFMTNGDIERDVGGGRVSSFQTWGSPVEAGQGSSREILCTLTSGSTLTDTNCTIDGVTWHNLGIERYFENTDSTLNGANKSSTINIQIRNVGQTVGPFLAADLVIIANANNL